MSSAKMAGVGGLGVCVCVCVWVGGGGGAEWSVKCLLDTWLGIGANWHNKYCTMWYIALFICPALSLGSKCT